MYLSTHVVTRSGESLPPIGGFYTQEEIREIVAYAADRQIEVIPEIDVPAHSNSALAAYPPVCLSGCERLYRCTSRLGRTKFRDYLLCGK